MRTAVASLIPLVLVSVATAQRPTAAPRDIVARAVAAVGGEQALRAVRTVTRQYYVSNYALGQEETPLSPARATTTVGTHLFDYAGNRSVTMLETRNLQGQVNRVRRVMAGDIGMAENNQGLSPAGPGVVAGDQRIMRRVAMRDLLAALDAPQTLSALPPKTWRGEMMDGVHYAAGPDTLDFWFDRRSGLLTVVATTTDDPILGDRQTVTWLTRWQPAGGVLFTRQQDTEVNGRLSASTVVTSMTVNADAPDSLFAIPDSIRARAQPATTPPTVTVTVTMVELAPGVWRAEGSTHHSLVVDQGAGLLVIEAPQTTARFQAVLDTLKGRFPGKPVSLVVNTHHHWDHAGGLRAALAAGLPVLTHARNEAFVRGIGTAKKSVAPDALSRAPKAPVVRTMSDSLVLGSGAGQVVLYRIPTVHVEGLLAAYVPSARVLFTSDALNPSTPLSPSGSAELVALAKARGLAVERYAGGHGIAVTWVDVERAAATPAP